jgi:hypothetical protein
VALDRAGKNSPDNLTPIVTATCAF